MSPTPRTFCLRESLCHHGIWFSIFIIHFRPSMPESNRIYKKIKLSIFFLYGHTVWQLSNKFDSWIYFTAITDTLGNKASVAVDPFVRKQFISNDKSRFTIDLDTGEKIHIRKKTNEKNSSIISFLYKLTVK